MSLHVPVGMVVRIQENVLLLKCLPPLALLAHWSQTPTSRTRTHTLLLPSTNARLDILELELNYKLT